MEKSEFIRVRVTREEKAFLELKAAQANATLSDYLRGVIQSIAKGSSPVDELAREHFELSIQTGLMVSKIMDRLLGDDEDARTLREQMRTRAGELAEKIMTRIRENK